MYKDVQSMSCNIPTVNVDLRLPKTQRVYATAREVLCICTILLGC